MNDDPKYASLKQVLEAAYERASIGKGKERHANHLPFDKQPILEITRDLGLGFPLGQARKKGQEANTLYYEAYDISIGTTSRDQVVNELFDAIVYLAAAVIYIKESTGGPKTRS